MLRLVDKTPRLGATPDNAYRAISKRPISLKEARIYFRASLAQSLIDQSDSEDVYREDTGQTLDIVLATIPVVLQNPPGVPFVDAQYTIDTFLSRVSTYSAPGVPVARSPVHLWGSP